MTETTPTGQPTELSDIRICYDRPPAARDRVLITYEADYIAAHRLTHRVSDGRLLFDVPVDAEISVIGPADAASPPLADDPAPARGTGTTEPSPDATGGVDRIERDLRQMPYPAADRILAELDRLRGEVARLQNQCDAEWEAHKVTRQREEVALKRSDKAVALVDEILSAEWVGRPQLDDWHQRLAELRTAAEEVRTNG